MKKCPKCGTILDDSKKKCYMCGAELTKKIEGSFAENFDAKIGAQTTRSQDNVFNNGVDIKARGKDMVGRNTNGAFFSNNSSSMGFFNNNNNMNRPPASNGFQGFEANNANRGGVSEKIKQSVSKKNVDTGADPTIMNFFEKSRDAKAPVSSTPNNSNKKPVKERKPVKEKTTEPFRINFNFIFNTLCFIVFLGIVLFGYLKFIKPKHQDNNSLNKLSYVISNDMTLSQDDKYSKYYTRGESCAIKISYGETTDVDGFTDNYFDQIRAEYANDSSHLTRSDDFKINGNKWSSLSVLEIVENPASNGGFSTVTKYKYISIVKDGNYYTIVYVNTEDDNTCSKAYDDFMNTLEFK